MSEGPGLLVVCGFFVTIIDEAGEELVLDSDFLGELGLEPVAFPIPSAGTYTVRIASHGGPGAATVVAGFLSIPELGEE